MPLSTRLLWRSLVFPQPAAPTGSSPTRGRRGPRSRRTSACRRSGSTSSRTGRAPSRASIRRRSRSCGRLGIGSVICWPSPPCSRTRTSAPSSRPSPRSGAVPGVVGVVPANPTPLGEELIARARALGVGEALFLPGWVSAADLEGLYAAAACFVFPSLREGFGCRCSRRCGEAFLSRARTPRQCRRSRAMQPSPSTRTDRTTSRRLCGSCEIAGSPRSSRHGAERVRRSSRGVAQRRRRWPRSSARGRMSFLLGVVRRSPPCRSCAG